MEPFYMKWLLTAIVPIATEQILMYHIILLLLKNKMEYFKFLKLAISRKLKLPKNFKKEILEWYYMYYLHNDDFLKTFKKNKFKVNFTHRS